MVFAQWLLLVLLISCFLISCTVSMNLPTPTPTLSLPATPRVVLSPLPTLYAYDHCPYCSRVRLALGVKKIKHNLHFLASDETAIPTSLIGKKMTPILSFEDSTGKSATMGESLDIISRIDSDATFGETHRIAPMSTRTDLQHWQTKHKDTLRVLCRPRYVANGLIPEFSQKDSRSAFINSHELPGFSHSDWVNNTGVTDEQKKFLYKALLSQDQLFHVSNLNYALEELDGLVHSEDYCTAGSGFSLDDVDLWSRLRGITLVKNVEWPLKIRKYLDNLSKLGDVPLYDAMAI
jgi:glutaredoxin 2